jgi:hypothetical protein
MWDTPTVGKWIILIGLGVVLLGGLVWVVGRAGLPLGRLPGDVRIERGGLSIYFPCATSILISIILTVALNLIVRFLRR